MIPTRQKDVLCCNCGKPGHVYRKCFQPITSIGLICCYTPTQAFDPGRMNQLTRVPSVAVGVEDLSQLSNKLLFKMIRRKDSLAFAEIVRGKFKLTDKKYITRLLSNVTKDEFKAIAEADTFDDIWYRLWTSKKNSKSRQNEYVRAKKKFYALRDGVKLSSGKRFTLRSLLQSTSTRWDTPEWGFPKGRRAPREDDIQCAIREFSEETDISPDRIKLLPVPPVEETFTGSNGVLYRHVYFLAYAPEWIEPTMNPKNKSQKAEVGDVRWFTTDEVLQHIRDDNPQRKDLFSRVAFYLSGILPADVTDSKQ